MIRSFKKVFGIALMLAVMVSGTALAVTELTEDNHEAIQVIKNDQNVVQYYKLDLTDEDYTIDVKDLGKIVDEIPEHGFGFEHQTITGAKDGSGNLKWDSASNVEIDLRILALSGNGEHTLTITDGDTKIMEIMADGNGTLAEHVLILKGEEEPLTVEVAGDKGKIKGYINWLEPVVLGTRGEWQYKNTEGTTLIQAFLYMIAGEATEDIPNHSISFIFGKDKKLLSGVNGKTVLTGFGDDNLLTHFGKEGFTVSGLEAAHPPYNFMSDTNGEKLLYGKDSRTSKLFGQVMLDGIIESYQARSIYTGGATKGTYFMILDPSGENGIGVMKSTEEIAKDKYGDFRFSAAKVQLVGTSADKTKGIPSTISVRGGKIGIGDTGIVKGVVTLDSDGGLSLRAAPAKIQALEGYTAAIRASDDVSGETKVTGGKLGLGKTGVLDLTKATSTTGITNNKGVLTLEKVSVTNPQEVSDGPVLIKLDSDAVLTLGDEPFTISKDATLRLAVNPAAEAGADGTKTATVRKDDGIDSTIKIKAGGTLEIGAGVNMTAIKIENSGVLALDKLASVTWDNITFNDGSTLKALTNLTLDEALSLGKTVSFDVNGQKIILTTTNPNVEGGTLQFKGTSGSVEGTVSLADNAKLALGGTTPDISQLVVKGVSGAKLLITDIENAAKIGTLHTKNLKVELADSVITALKATPQADFPTEILLVKAGTIKDSTENEAAIDNASLTGNLKDLVATTSVYELTGNILTDDETHCFNITGLTVKAVDASTKGLYMTLELESTPPTSAPETKPKPKPPVTEDKPNPPVIEDNSSSQATEDNSGSQATEDNSGSQDTEDNSSSQVTEDNSSSQITDPEDENFDPDSVKDEITDQGSLDQNNTSNPDSDNSPANDNYYSSDEGSTVVEGDGVAEALEAINDGTDTVISATVEITTVPTNEVAGIQQALIDKGTDITEVQQAIVETITTNLTAEVKDAVNEALGEIVNNILGSTDGTEGTGGEVKAEAVFTIPADKTEDDNSDVPVVVVVEANTQYKPADNISKNFGQRVAISKKPAEYPIKTDNKVTVDGEQIALKDEDFTAYSVIRRGENVRKIPLESVANGLFMDLAKAITRANDEFEQFFLLLPNSKVQPGSVRVADGEEDNQKGQIIRTPSNYIIVGTGGLSAVDSSGPKDDTATVNKDTYFRTTWISNFKECKPEDIETVDWVYQKDPDGEVIPFHDGKNIAKKKFTEPGKYTVTATAYKDGKNDKTAIAAVKFPQVTVVAGTGDEQENQDNWSNKGGGCATGFAGLAALVLVPMFFRDKNKNKKH